MEQVNIRRTRESKKAAVPPAAGVSAERDLPLRITLLQPPPGVRFCLQRGRDERVGQTDSSGQDISFDLSVRVKSLDGGSPPRLLGPFTQGPPTGRFVYVCSGTLAGQTDSPWSRRAKVGLTRITPALIEEALKNPGSKLEARFHGMAGDGGPSCATVRLIDGGWRVIRASAPARRRRAEATREQFTNLKQVPNVGPAVAADLRLLGIDAPQDLRARDPYKMYDDLCRITGTRHDPCVLDTFIAAVRFMGGEPGKPWWKYTAERKRHLAIRGVGSSIVG